MRSPSTSRIVALTTVLLAVVVGAMLGKRNTPETSPPDPLRPDLTPSLDEPSPTPRSMTLAEAGIDPSALNPDVDPCSDFYAFACAGWEKRFDVPKGYSKWMKAATELEAANSQVIKDLLVDAAAYPERDPIREAVGDYYEACVDDRARETAGIAPLQPILAQVEGITDLTTLTHALASLHRIGVFVFFSPESARSPDDPSHVILQLGIPLARGYHLPPKPGSPLPVGALSPYAPFYPALAEPSSMDTLIRIDGRLLDLQKKRGLNKTRRVDRKHLREITSHIAWDEYFSDLGHPEWNEVAVTSTDYLAEIDTLLSTESVNALRSYLAFQLLDEFSTDIPQLRRTSHSLGRALLIGFDVHGLPNICRRETELALGEDLGALWAEEKFPGNDRLIAWGIAGSIAEQLRSDVGRVAWMDQTTGARAIRKMDQMALRIGYPTAPRRYRFKPDRNDWLADRLAADLDRVAEDFDRVGKPLERSRWRIQPTTVNAGFIPNDNALEFPAGILLPPYFDARHVAAVNYGSIGTVMGHELTHGLDEGGSHFDAQGQHKDWWTTTTYARFRDNETCLTKQFSSYPGIWPPGSHLDGKATLEENTADLGGVKVAWEAWKASNPPARVPVIADGFDEDQLFFLAFAQDYCEKGSSFETDPHSPGRFRVIGTLSNTSAFGAAFHCAKGSPMQPENSCSVW